MVQGGFLNLASKSSLFGIWQKIWEYKLVTQEQLYSTVLPVQRIYFDNNDARRISIRSNKHLMLKKQNQKYQNSVKKWYMVKTTPAAHTEGRWTAFWNYIKNAFVMSDFVKDKSNFNS